MNRHSLWRDLSHFPWRNTAAVLGERFREDRLGLTASSLTFTTTIALVPFFTVALALFTAFPMFGKMQGGCSAGWCESLIPENIARQVLGYLTQFASKAGGLGVLGLAVLLLTAFALILTIDRTLNNIWRVRSAAAAGAAGAGLLGGGHAGADGAGAQPDHHLLCVRGFARAGGRRANSSSCSTRWSSRCWPAAWPRCTATCPIPQVKWSHAVAGGLFVAVAIEIAKKLLAFYFGFVPTYSVLYGAFATFPILLVWIYIAWVIVLFGAVIAAYLPSLLSGVARRGGTPGWSLQLAHRGAAAPGAGAEPRRSRACAPASW